MANTWAAFGNGGGSDGGAYTPGNGQSYAGTPYNPVFTFNDPWYATSYSLSNPGPGAVITSATFNALVANVNAVRARRFTGPGSFTTSGTITAADVNTLVSALNVAGTQPNNGYIDANNILQTWGFSGYVASGPAGAGGYIYASHLDTIMSHVNAAANLCTCNCNYCTCNCNYCTCNCNYACTCNCNYSDKRLKMNIKFLRDVEGVNLYEFSYLWDATKRFVGVMAQELIGTKYEGALSKDAHGVYMVDYNMLPVKMEAVGA